MWLPTQLKWQNRKVRRSASAPGVLLLALVVYRVRAHIPVPGIDPANLQQLFSGQQGGILNLFNMFSAGRCRASRSSRWGSCRTSRHRSSCN